MKTRIRKLTTSCAISMLVLVTGCAAGPKINLVEPGDRIAISAADASADGVDDVSIGNDAVGGDLARGAGGGLLAGGAAGMSCGPWAFLCVPALAVSGAVVGGAGGAVVGSFRGIDSEQKHSVLARIHAHFEDQQPTTTLMQTVGDRISKSWQVVDGETDNELVINVERIGVDGQGSGMVTLELRVSVIVRGAARGRPGEVRRSFTYKSTPTPVALWIEDADGFVESEFIAAYRAITLDVYYAMYGG